MGGATGSQLARREALECERQVLNLNLGPEISAQWRVGDIHVRVQLPEPSSPSSPVSSSTSGNIPEDAPAEGERCCVEFDIRTFQCGPAVSSATSLTSSPASTPCASPKHATLPTIVLIHGMTEGIPFYARLMAHLAPFARVLALDLPGMGLSQFPDLPKGYESKWKSVEAETFFVHSIDAWLTEILPPEENGNVYMVGHSFGGYIAMVYAMTFPSRVRKLFLLSPMLGFRDKEALLSAGGKFQNLASLIEWGIDHRVTPQAIMRKALPGLGTMARRYLKDKIGLIHGLSPEEANYLANYRVAVAERIDERGNPTDMLFYACFGSWLRPMRRMEVRWPRKGRCDCLFFYGSNDLLEVATAVDICAKLAKVDVTTSLSKAHGLRRCHQAELLIVPNAGHSPHMEQPEFVAEEILSRIDEISEGRRRASEAASLRKTTPDRSPQSQATASAAASAALLAASGGPLLAAAGAGSHASLCTGHNKRRLRCRTQIAAFQAFPRPRLVKQVAEVASGENSATASEAAVVPVPE